LSFAKKSFSRFELVAVQPVGSGPPPSPLHNAAMKPVPSEPVTASSIVCVLLSVWGRPQPDRAGTPVRDRRICRPPDCTLSRRVGPTVPVPKIQSDSLKIEGVIDIFRFFYITGPNCAPDPVFKNRTAPQCAIVVISLLCFVNIVLFNGHKRAYINCVFFLLYPNVLFSHQRPVEPLKHN